MMLSAILKPLVKEICAMSSWMGAAELFDEFEDIDPKKQGLTSAQAPFRGRKTAFSTEESQLLTSMQKYLPKQGVLPFSDVPTVIDKPVSQHSQGDLKEIARALVRKIPQAVWDQLFQERAQLLDKAEAQELTKKENTRLKHINWQLDNLDDATIGPSLDTIGMIADAYEQLAEDVQNYAHEIKHIQNRKRRSHRGRRG
jgi:hypothetical protein